MIIDDTYKTKFKLLILTNPSCSICKILVKNNLCSNIHLTKYYILSPYSKTDEENISNIFKVNDKLNLMKKIMIYSDDKQIFNNIKIENKDFEVEWKRNLIISDYLINNYSIKGTPHFFILDEKDEIIDNFDLSITIEEILKFKLGGYNG